MWPNLKGHKTRRNRGKNVEPLVDQEDAKSVLLMFNNLYLLQETTSPKCIFFSLNCLVIKELLVQ